MADASFDEDLALEPGEAGTSFDESSASNCGKAMTLPATPSGLLGDGLVYAERPLPSFSPLLFPRREVRRIDAAERRKGGNEKMKVLIDLHLSKAFGLILSFQFLGASLWSEELENP